MTQKILVNRAGAAGIITLNRPEAINALDLEMVQAIDAALADFEADDAIRLVVLEGSGARGFCAGGDMRTVRQMVLDEDFESPKSFFETEYTMNLHIASAQKPIAVLAHGVVMGGGIGIAGHAHFRFATADARFAMPEGAIALHCDTGVNALLAQTQSHRALAFCLAGVPVGADAALALGLTDCVINADRQAEVRAQIISTAQAHDVARALTGVMQSFGVVPGDSGFAQEADALASDLKGDSAAQIVAALRALPNLMPAQKLLAVIDQRCPTTLEVIVQSLRAARRHLDLETILARDLRLSQWLIARPDFAEGVRAVLVDKDRNPSWSPARVEDVDILAVSRIIAD